jgi:hypothetical protein
MPAEEQARLIWFSEAAADAWLKRRADEMNPTNETKEG